MDALKELDIPVIRYPGGNFVATYHWQDGVGPREKRPKRPELAWLGTEPNEFGTDDFMQWLSVLSEGKEKRVEPYICLNMGTGTLDEALSWVEYCNGTKDTYYANLRRQNGHPEPYNVKYWALGNEIWGPWQVEQMTKEDYAKKAFQWAKALRLLDPNLCLILCGETGHSSWDHHVLKECVPLVDMHSIHIYTASKKHLPNVMAPLSAERAIQTAAALIDIARIENNVAPTKPPVKICFDEWNVWDPERAPGDKGAEEKYTLSDALGVAVWLNVFVRQSKYIGMANIAQVGCLLSPLTRSFRNGADAKTKQQKTPPDGQCHLATYDDQGRHCQADNMVAAPTLQQVHAWVDSRGARQEWVVHGRDDAGVAAGGARGRGAVAGRQRGGGRQRVCERGGRQHQRRA